MNILKAIVSLIITLVIGFILGYFFSPVDRVITKTEIKILREYSSSELIYNECLRKIVHAIDPWRGSIEDYPQKDFSNLIEQCVELKTKS